MVWSDVAAILHQLWIAVAAGDVAENLIVGAVLFNDKDDVLNAQLRRLFHSAGGLKFRRIRGGHLTGSRGNLRVCDGGNLGECADVCQAAEGAGLVRGVARTLDVEDSQSAVAVYLQGRRKPAGGDGAAHFPLFTGTGQDGNCVVAATGYVEALSIGREYQGDGLAANSLPRPRWNCHVRALARRSVDQRQRIGVPVGYGECLSVRTDGQV